MHKLLFSAALSAGLSVLAVASPSVTGVTWTQDADTRLVTVNYTLAGAPAVVTFDFLTNGVSIGGANVTGGDVPKPQPVGDVFKRVTTDGAHAFTWRPDRAWGDHLAEGELNVKAWALDDPPDYMVYNLADGVTDRLSFYPGVEWLPGGPVANTAYATTSILMRRIHAGGVTWTMGSYNPTAAAGYPKVNDEKSHLVTLASDYYIGVFEVTMAQFKKVGGISTDFYFTNDDKVRRPAGRLSYTMIREAKSGTGTGVSVYPSQEEYRYPNPPSPDTFLGKLQAQSGIAFDLPGEAQWEFAARGGHGDGYWPDGTAWAFSQMVTNNNVVYYMDDVNLHGHARFKRSNADPTEANIYSATVSNGTAIVGSYSPNGFGLYDMLGNVSEWCQDWYASDITGLNGAVNANGLNYKDGAADKTVETADKGTRVMRGGSYITAATCCRPGYRASGINSSLVPSCVNTYFTQTLSNIGYGGFRLMCPIDLKEAK